MARAVEEPSQEDGEHPFRVRRPHAITDVGVEAEAEAEPLPDDDPFPDNWQPDDRTVFGKALHAYLAGLPSLGETAEEEKHGLAARCLERTDGTQFCEARWVVEAGDRFRAWVDQQFNGFRWYPEVPVTAPREEGGSWVGTIDLLLVDDDGRAVVIDHKAASVRSERWEGQALEHTGQLWAYDRCVRAQGMSIAGTWIHFPVSGAVVQVDLQAGNRT